MNTTVHRLVPRARGPEHKSPFSPIDCQVHIVTLCNKHKSGLPYAIPRSWIHKTACMQSSIIMAMGCIIIKRHLCVQPKRAPWSSAYASLFVRCEQWDGIHTRVRAVFDMAHALPRAVGLSLTEPWSVSKSLQAMARMTNGIFDNSAEKYLKCFLLFVAAASRNRPCHSGGASI